jgi:nondiscriminating aspartyl-tRNA synthetase
MKRVLTQELLNHLGQTVILKGWLNNVRSLGKIHFLILRDRLGFTQVTIESQEEFAKIKNLQPGTVLQISGQAIAAPNCEYKVEVINPSIEVLVPVLEASPVEYYKPEIPSDLDFILDHRPIALRNREIQAIFKIQAEIVHAFRLYMHDNVKAVEYFAPNIIGASSEGGAEFFNVDYFGYTATLAQSSQLYKQIMVGVNERVFALMPFFRAEPSHTPRHLSEGKQFEFEMGFFDDWHEILDIQEGLIKFIVDFIQKNCEKELITLGNPLIKAPLDVDFPRITFLEAQEIYFKRTGVDERQEPDLSPAAEKELCQWALEEKGTELVFITDWKRSKRPFYSFPNENNPELTNTFDLLCAGTEITSGGQRRHTFDSMVEGILEKEMDPNNFKDYLSIFKFGMPPHGGFGMGLERLTMTLLRLKNIRQTSLFPSDPKRIAANRLRAKIFFGEENVRNEIIRLLKNDDCVFNHLKHDSTLTSEESAKIRGTTLEEGVKAIILRGKTSKKNYQFNIPSHLKLDMKAVADAVKEKCEFEDPLIIEERFGLKVGSIPPFGTLLNLDTYYDERISKQEKAAFNCGLTTESIVCKTKDLIKIVDPKFGTFTKDS